MKFKRASLAKDEGLTRKALFWGVGTLMLLGGLTIWGIPLLIKISDFLVNWRSQPASSSPAEKIPPTPPRLTPLPEATNSAVLVISGFSEPKTKVTVYLNDEPLSTIEPNEQGKFEIEKAILSEGENRIWAQAEDKNGNLSPKSETITIVYDTQPPKLEIKQPENKAVVDKQELVVEGVTEPEARLTINDQLVVVTPQGEFSHTYLLSEGPNVLKIVAQDKAGNKTEKEILVTWLP